MKKSKILSLILCLAIIFQLTGYIPALAEQDDTQQEAAVQSAVNPFRDVPEDQWYYQIVMTAYEKNLFAGTSDNEFSPEAGMTRAMFVTVLGKMEGIDTSQYQGSDFTDVENGAWYAPYVKWGYQEGVVSGYGNNIFGTEDLVTREQMATFISKYLDKYGFTLSNAETVTPSYGDMSQTATWAVASVKLTWASGIFVGDNEGNFNPGATALRAEAAAVFLKVLDALNPDMSHREETEDVDILSNVKQISSQTNIVSYEESDDGYTISIENASSEITSLRAGDTFVLLTTDKFPSGLAGIVRSISTSGSLTVIQATTPELGDVFSKIDVAKEVDLLTSEDVTVSLPDEGQTALMASGGITVNKYSDRYEIKLTGYQSDQVSLTGTLSIYQPKLYGDVDYNVFSGLNSMNVSVSQTNTATMTFKGSNSYDTRLKLCQFSVPIATGISATVYINLHLSASGSFKIEQTFTVQEEIGAKYQKGGSVQLYQNVSAGMDPTTVEFQAKAQLTANPQVMLSAFSIDIYGFEGDFGKGIKTDQTMQNCDLCLTFGLYNVITLGSVTDRGVLKDVGFLQFKIDLTKENITKYGYVSPSPLGIYWDSCPHDVGTLSGKVVSADDRTTPIGGATVSVYQNGSLIKTVTTNSSGNYSTSLPSGDYLIEISANGYLSFQSYESVRSGEVTYAETFLMIVHSDTPGTASGTISNALTGSGLADVTLEIRSGWNNASSGNIVTTAKTDSSGRYSLTLPLGNYTILASKSGFISANINIVVKDGTTADQNGSISPVISGDSFRIVLTWGENPRDLDSHIRGSLSNGNPFHVYFGSKSASDNGVTICALDVDDRYSYGPETITLTTNTEHPYYYYVHRYAGSGSLATSEAQVKVYQGESLLATFNVPTDQNNGDYWNVFAIVNGNLVVSNTITNSDANVSYAG